jgi:hypothetical protein
MALGVPDRLYTSGSAAAAVYGRGFGMDEGYPARRWCHSVTEMAYCFCVQ